MVIGQTNNQSVNWPEIATNKPLHIYQKFVKLTTNQWMGLEILARILKEGGGGGTVPPSFSVRFRIFHKNIRKLTFTCECKLNVQFVNHIYRFKCFFTLDIYICIYIFFFNLIIKFKIFTMEIRTNFLIIYLD